MPASLSNREFHNLKSALDEAAIVAITDKNGVITYVNKKFCAISKYSAEELIGKTHKVVNSGYHPPQFFAEMWATIKSGKNWEGEIRNRAKDGSFYWVYTTIVPFLDENGHPESYVAVRYEITELIDERENFQTLFNSTFEGVVVVAQGRILAANQAVCDIFKCSAEDFNQKNLDKFIHPKFIKEMRDQLSSGRHLRTEVPAKTLSGNDLYLGFTSRTVNFKGQWVSLVAIRDLTERRAIETQLIQQDRLASMGLLASSLAHEIGTPLGVIRGRAELIQKKSDEKTKSTMDIIIVQIDRITKLVNSLLHIGRNSSSHVASDVNLSAVLNDVLLLIGHELDRNEIKYNLNINESLIVQAESGPLGQVFLNLLVNAIHAIKSKKSDTPKVINIKSLEVGQVVHVSIEDSGVGIEEKDFSRLFQPFFTTKEVGEGTGLGLATSYKLVHSWGGSMQVQSKLGEGSTFTVTLRK